MTWVWSLGRYPGRGNGNPLQWSCLENSTDRGSLQAIVHGLQRMDCWWNYEMIQFSSVSQSCMNLCDPVDCSTPSFPAHHCQGPVWGTPPMAKVMRKEAWHMQRRDQASGNPLFPSIYPKTRVCFMLSPITVSLREGVNTQLQGNKNSWEGQECFSLWTPLKVI